MRHTVPASEISVVGWLVGWLVVGWCGSAAIPVVLIMISATVIATRTLRRRRRNLLVVGSCWCCCCLVVVVVVVLVQFQPATAAAASPSSSPSSSLFSSSSSSSSLFSSLSSLPWQDDEEDSASSYAGRTSRSVVVDTVDYASDVPPTVFDPSGRLLAVESILAQTCQSPEDPSSSSLSLSSFLTLVVAIQCRHGLVIVTSLPTSPYLSLFMNDTEHRNNSSSNSSSSNSSISNNNRTNTSSNHKPVTEKEEEEEKKKSDQKPLQYQESIELLLEHDTSRSTTRMMTPPFVRLSASLFGITAGNAVDAQVVRQNLYDIAQSLRQRHDEQHEPSPSSPPSSPSPTGPTMTTVTTQVVRGRAVARLWADRLQARTQQGQAGRLLATSVILVDAAAATTTTTTRNEASDAPFQEEEDGNEPSYYNGLWQVDPTGVFYSCQAAVAGRASPLAHELLLELVQEKYLWPRSTFDDSSLPASAATTTTITTTTTNQDDGDDNNNHNNNNSESWSTKSLSDGANDSNRGDTRRRRRHVRQALYDLSCTEALQLATQVVQSTLTKVTTTARTTLKGNDWKETRIQGLVIRHRAHDTATTAQWYTQRELEALLARKDSEEN